MVNRRFLTTLLCLLLCSGIAAAKDANKFYKSGNDRFSFKVQPFMGTYLMPSSNLSEINPNGPAGLNLGVEFPSSQQRPWQQYLNNPTVGLGMSYIDMGHKTMGEGIAVYPYIMLNGFRSQYFNLKVKLGSGLVALSQHYYKALDEPIPNKTFATTLNAYLTGGLNLEFPITRNITLNGELGFFHMSNGRTREPNKGANVLYGGVGLVATINPTAEDERQPITFPDLPYKWSLNITAASGVHAADRTDANRFAIFSFHVGAIYNTCNWHGIGLGADLFYNDAIGNPMTNRGMYRITNERWRRMRGGLSLNNEFKFGNFTAMLDWGVYLFNPVRNLYANDHPIYGQGRRPLFYKSEGTGTDERFHYIRFGIKYRVYDNIHLQALAKTHMHICELIEFGISYQIPFVHKGKRINNKKIFHHRRNWWKEY
ncbi:MAG: acyloxyacyl hydrolase [Alistipes sp.]|nr:acyloxyacyl hydrolase [Alistipes sp.]